MSKLKALFLILALALSTSGCASWAAQFRANPIATIERGVSYIGNAVQLARVAFDLVAAVDPAANNSRGQFEAIVGRVGMGVDSALSTLQLATHATDNDPNPDALLHDAQTAMSDLHNFLASLSSSGPGHAAGPEMQAALHATAQAALPLRR